MAPAGISVTVERLVRASPRTTFDTIMPVDLSTIFGGLGPLPAVVGTREQTGAWDHEGASRIVMLGDGSEAHEQLTTVCAPAVRGVIGAPRAREPLRGRARAPACQQTSLRARHFSGSGCSPSCGKQTSLGASRRRDEGR